MRIESVRKDFRPCRCDWNQSDQSRRSESLSPDHGHLDFECAWVGPHGSVAAQAGQRPAAALSDADAKRTEIAWSRTLRRFCANDRNRRSERRPPGQLFDTKDHPCQRDADQMRCRPLRKKLICALLNDWCALRTPRATQNIDPQTGLNSFGNLTPAQFGGFLTN